MHLIFAVSAFLCSGQMMMPLLRYTEDVRGIALKSCLFVGMGAVF